MNNEETNIDIEKLVISSDKKEISQSPPLLRTDRAIFTAISSSINN